MCNYYHVRINDTAKNPKYDYQVFLETIKSKTEAPWDKDHHNKIKVGDYVGFITGKKDTGIIVEIYKVKSETERANHWNTVTPYVNGNGINIVEHRTGILLTNVHDLPKIMEWELIKECIKFAPNNPSWMPRGMQVVKNKNLLPFRMY
jgi:putative ribosome biogenesis GTPase RsgA